MIPQRARRVLNTVRQGAVRGTLGKSSDTLAPKYVYIHVDKAYPSPSRRVLNLLRRKTWPRKICGTPINVVQTRRPQPITDRRFTYSCYCSYIRLNIHPQSCHCHPTRAVPPVKGCAGLCSVSDWVVRVPPPTTTNTKKNKTRRSCPSSTRHRPTNWKRSQTMT